MKITFECSERWYRTLCDIEEYYRSTEHLRERKIASLEDVIRLLLDRGLAYISMYEECPDFDAFKARRHGAEVSLDVEGNLTRDVYTKIFFSI